MPSSTVRTFSDPDDYAAAMRQGTMELAVTERGSLTAKLTRIDLHRLWMQRLSENLSRIYHVDGWGGRAIIAFRTETGPSVVHDGVELQPNDIVWFSPGRSYYQYSSGPAAFAGMSLPVADMLSVGADMAGCELAPPRDTLVFRLRQVRLQCSSGCTRLPGIWRKPRRKSSPIAMPHMAWNRLS